MFFAASIIKEILCLLPLTLTHRLNMELDLQKLFGLLCTAVIRNSPLPPAFGLIQYTRALWVSQDRRDISL